jgi:two-component system, OmpR family, response regulator
LRLLLVEDNSRLVELLSERIHGAGWRVDCLATVAEAEVVSRIGEHDLMLIDIGLPDGDGLELIREIRRQGNDVPIIVVSALGSIEDRIAGLDSGADDYLVKPFNHLEFLARCRAMFRRSTSTALQTLSVGKLVYDPLTTSLKIDEEILQFSPRENALLEILLRESGNVVRKTRLETALSEFGSEITPNAIEVMISRVRKKLEMIDAGITIDTVRGIGYLLRALDK